MKKLGQHFLKDKSAIKKIIDALDLQSSNPVKSNAESDHEADFVIEIGPGHGELTEEFNKELRTKNNGIKIFAIEKDKKLAEQLRKKFSEKEGVEIIDGDALKVLPELCFKLHASRFKVCGNIPYYITGKLLRILSEVENKPELSIFTIQKEVAERICVAPPRMNRLAAITQFWSKPEIIMEVGRGSFSPPPKVDSAIIKLESRIENKELWKKQGKYYKTVRLLFAQPRKTILNNLVSGKWLAVSDKEKVVAALEKVKVNPNDRPQNLSVEEIIKISELTG